MLLKFTIILKWHKIRHTFPHFLTWLPLFTSSSLKGSCEAKKLNMSLLSLISTFNNYASLSKKSLKLCFYRASIKKYKLDYPCLPLKILWHACICLFLFIPLNKLYRLKSNWATNIFYSQRDLSSRPLVKLTAKSIRATPRVFVVPSGRTQSNRIIKSKILILIPKT